MKTKEEAHSKKRIQRQNLFHEFVALGLQNVSHAHRSRVDAVAGRVVYWRRRWRSVRVRRNRSCVSVDAVKTRRDVFDADAKLDLLDLFDANDSRRNSDAQAYE